MLSSNGEIAEVMKYSLAVNIEQLIALNPFYQHDFTFLYYWLNLPTGTPIQPWWQSTGIVLGYCFILWLASHYTFQKQNLNF
jgi:hypothetical protein